MALLNVGDVVQSVATLLDDPGQTDIDVDYVIPFLNLRWANLVVNLAMLGLQYSEEVAIFNIAANTLTLTAYMAAGLSLASLMRPISVEWKPVGAPDTEYSAANSVNELDDFPDGTAAVQQYAWQRGTVLLSKCSIPVTLRVKFTAMSTTLVDPTDEMVRGVGDIIAYKVAELVAVVRGNATLKLDMIRLGDEALDDFCALGVMTSQSQFTRIPPTHRRGPRGVNFTMAPSR